MYRHGLQIRRVEIWSPQLLEYRKHTHAHNIIYIEIIHKIIHKMCVHSVYIFK